MRAVIVEQRCAQTTVSSLAGVPESAFELQGNVDKISKARVSVTILDEMCSLCV